MAKYEISQNWDLSRKTFDSFPQKIVKLARSLGKESMANILALNLYPLGWIEKDVPVDPHPVYATNPNPVILVHGIVHNHSAFLKLRSKMKKAGFKNVYAINYTTSYGSIHKMAGEISDRIDKILLKTGAKQIDIVAHSLGGLVCRHYMTQASGRGKVRKLITLGTPHNGTKLSQILRFVPGSSLAADLSPNSYFLRGLECSPIPRDSQIISINSKFDWTLFPERNTEAKGIPENSLQNITFDDIGHTGLLYSIRVFNEIVRLLDQS